MNTKHMKIFSLGWEQTLEDKPESQQYCEFTDM
jgi:hypothetical protein